MKVAVVGAGKMGLPLACRFAARGAHVVACDANPDVVAAVGRGECPFAEPGVPELLARMVEEGRLEATADTAEAARRSDAVVVIVPALLTPERRADLGALEAVTRQIAAAVHEGLLVSYETTVPVGATRNVFLPVLASGGRKVGRDLFVAFSPERVKSGSVLQSLGVTPKIVGGVDAESGRRAERFYAEGLGAPVINVGSAEAAEFVKLAGMVYRDVNIAMSNELARYAEAVGLDFPSLISPANTDGEAGLLQPGIGVGGHCTPVYPYFMIPAARAAGVPARLAELAREINDGQAGHAVGRLEKALGTLRGARVLILGLGFRPGVKEHTCSPAFLIQADLRRRGAEVEVHDDLYSAEELVRHGFRPGGWGGDKAPDVLVLATAHPSYRGLDFAELSRRGLRAVLDGRNLWDVSEVRRCGLIHIGMGR